MEVYFDSHKGMVRDNNEDYFLVVEKQRFKLYAVADGMGGHQAGEIASKTAINVLKDYFDKESNDFVVPKFINESINEANRKIRDESYRNEACHGMGTTMTMAVVDSLENIAYIGNVGDSRTYLIRNNQIKQITEDHTYVYELLKQGKISIDEAKNHPKRNVITRAIGSEDLILTDIFEIELLEDDILLLCSDGLIAHLSDEEILKIIMTYGCSESVSRLIKLCNDYGGSDNITVIIIHNNLRGDKNDW